MNTKQKIQLKQTILGDGIPKICVPIVGRTDEEVLSQVRAAKAQAPDLVEWRVDVYEHILEEARTGGLLSACSECLGQIPLLFTFRTEQEGGNRPISATAYRRLNLWAAVQPEIDMIDVEGRQSELQASALIRDIRRAGKPVVASSHFFERTPEKQEMLAILEELRDTGAEVLKLAVMPQTPEDVLALLEVTRMASQRLPNPLITMSMGRLGAISRISGSLTGSALTFGAVGAASAPGQLPASELRRILRQL